MAAVTFSQLWNQLKLLVPAAPALLCRLWVLNTYKESCDESNWSFLRGEDEFQIRASRSGTVVLTQDDATVSGTGVSGGVTFVATDVGRQMKFASGPPITIISVDLTGNTSCELERTWKGATSASSTVTIADLYATCPQDFGHFLAVVDVEQQRRIRIFTTEQEAYAADPARMNTGTPWALVNYRLSALASTLGRVQYEWWPYFAGASASAAPLRYPYLYVKRPQEPAEDDYFQGPLRDRDDALLEGAMAKAARWPGTQGQPNPYFNLKLASDHEARFREKLGLVEVKDQEMYLTWWMSQKLGIYGMNPLTPVDANFMQSHE